MPKTSKMSENQKKHNKIRNQLIGLATFLIILAIVAPWVLTDKSKQSNSATSILQSNTTDVLNSEPDNVNHDINNNNITDTSDIPYIPDTSSNDIDTTLPPEFSTDLDITTINATPSTPLNGKTYTIQLVALKNRQKIDELVALLRLNNYDVKLVPSNPAPNQLIRLQLGPYAQKTQAEQVIINLKNLTKLQGDIIGN